MEVIKETVEVKTAKVEQVEVKISEVEQVEVKISEGIKTAEVEQVEAKISEVEQVEAKIFEVEQVEAKISEVEQVEAKISEVEQVEAKISEVEQVEAKISEVEQVKIAETEVKIAETEVKIAEVEQVKIAEVEQVKNDFKKLNVSSLEYCIKLMNSLVRLIYYGVRDPQKYDNIINKIKSIRSLNDQGNKRLKFILTELVVNSEKLQKQFKPINNLKKNDTMSVNEKINQNKNEIMKSLGILTNKSEKKSSFKSKWGDSSSEDSN
jgi:hypothetical protein